MKKLTIIHHIFFKPTWRIAWYGVFVWVLSFIVSTVVILPWFYVVFPLVTILVSYFYFGKFTSTKKELTLFKGTFFAQGLAAGFIWFLAIFAFDFIQFVGLDLSGAGVYFLDSRNFIKYPIAILIPTLFGLIVENKNKFRSSIKKKTFIFHAQ